MPLKSTTNVTEIEQQVADLIGRQRELRDAVFDIRDDLPLSIRFALDRACKSPPEKLLTASGLEEASEVSGRLRSFIRELGGAPTLCHTDEGDPYTVGGTEPGRRAKTLLDCLDEFLRRAWRATDLLRARAALGNLDCSRQNESAVTDMI